MTTTSEESKREAPRDADAWAKPVSRLRVSDVPAGALNLNVDGRQVVGPLQGFGQLWQKTYRIRLTGCEAGPAEIIRFWKEHLPDLMPADSRFYPSLTGVEPGEVLRKPEMCGTTRWSAPP